MPINRKMYKNLIFFYVVLETLFSKDNKKGKTLQNPNHILIILL